MATLLYLQLCKKCYMISTCTNYLSFFLIGTFWEVYTSMKIKRETKKTNTGNNYYRVTYPKFKLGEEVVREVLVPPTYSKKTFLLGHKN